MTKSLNVLLALGLFFCFDIIQSQDLLLEAESFDDKGGVGR